MKTFIYPEMMVHIPVCTHKAPKSTLIVSDSASLLEDEIARHATIETTTIASTKALDGIRNLEDNSFDIIMLEASTDAALLAHCNRVLKEDGLISMQHPSLDDNSANKQLMEILGKYFKIIMPYRLENGETLLLASKEYHPTADVILHRTDLLEGQQYYNCDVHISTFAMPNYVRKAYLGVIKN
jgi:spermidine synthase